MTDPFVPLFQPAMIEFKNLTLAGLFGLIWRRAQNGTGRCTASHQHMAETLGITVRTIQREIKKLAENGYIEDHKPEARERMTTHEYSITPKGLGLVPDQIGDKTSLNNEESNQIPEENKRQNVVTTRQNVAKNPDKRQSVATKRQNVIQRYKEDKREEDIKEERDPPPTKTSQHRVDITPPSPSKPAGQGSLPQTNVEQLADTIADLCKIDRALASNGKLQKIKAATVKLYARQASPDDVKGFGRWWTSFDWRGQKGSPPTPDQICDEWERFRGAKLNGSPLSKLTDEQLAAYRAREAERR